MYRVFLAAVDVVPAAVVIIPFFGILYATAYRHDLRKSACYCLFCLYLCAIFSLVGIPNVTYFRPDLNLNWIPFFGILADWKNSILNVALFLPLGFFLPLLWQQFRKPVPSAAFAFALSLTIELLQMLTFRATDINDLITNVTGCIAGFLLAKPLTNRFPVVGSGTVDVFLLSALSFGTMFFAHPFLSPLIWDRIL